MVIAVNTRFLLKGQLEGYGHFTKEIFSILARDHPEHQFYFLFDRPYDESFVFNSNVHPLVLSPPARHPLLWKYWYDYKVPALLKKIRADVFVSPDGFCSLRTRVPQCLTVHDLGFLHFPSGYKRSHLLFYRRYTPRFLQKAEKIITVSQFSKKDIIASYGVPSDKVSVVYNAARQIFHPLTADEAMNVKERYTGGKEYFIHVGSIHPRKNLVNLLKAFSIFKKRQQSGMKLLLCGRLAWHTEEFQQLLGTYKFRDDVILLHYVEETELAQLVGAAYALVYPSFFEGFGMPVVEAMQCDVPVLCSGASSMEEVAGDAALYFDPHDVSDMAEKIMMVYKDESLRAGLINKGRASIQKYSWEKSANAIWEIILAAAGVSASSIR